MRNKIIITITALIAVAVLVVGGFFVFGKDAPGTTNPVKKPVATETETPVETETPAPEPTEDTDYSTDAEIAAAQEMFPDATATEKHTKEEVQLSLATAFAYTSQTLGDTVFTTGRFLQTETFDPEYFNTVYRGYFTEEGMAKVLGYMYILESDEYSDETQMDSISQLRAMTGIETTYPGLEASPSCSTEVNEQTDCFLQEPKYGNLSFYDHDETGELVIGVTATSYPIYYKDGVRGYVERTHEIYFTMAKADAADNVEQGYGSYSIKDISAGLEGSQWVASE